MTSNSAGVYHDFQGIAALKHQARQDQAGSLERVAKQFESLFVQMMVKQMRQASFGGGIFDTDRTRQYQDMYDKQLALHLSESGGLGIAELLTRQLGSESVPPLGSATSLQDYRQNPVASALRYASVRPLQQTQVEQPVARKTTQSTTRTAGDHLSSLFIRSGRRPSKPPAASVCLRRRCSPRRRWRPVGEGMSCRPAMAAAATICSASRRTRIGMATGCGVSPWSTKTGWRSSRREYFRSYESFDDSFQDYVEFLKHNPRYADALAKTHDSRAYFDALQQAGYATDPSYAEKIVQLLEGPRMERAVAQLKSAEPLPL